MSLTGSETPVSRPDESAAMVAVEGYASTFRPGSCDRALMVALSTRAALPQRPRAYDQDALYVADLDGRYFLSNPEALVAAITAFVDARGYGRVLFTGMSKAGFGALMLAGACARARPRLPVRALAFSPQAGVWPFDPALTFPSYGRLYGRARRRPAFAQTLRRFGDLSHLNWLGNFRGAVVYPTQNAVDRQQALRLRGPNMRLYPVETRTHQTAFFFAWRGLPEETIRIKLETMFAKKAAADPDLAATRLGIDLDAVARAVVEARLPTLEELVDEAMAAEQPHETPAARLRRIATLRLVLGRMALRRVREVVGARLGVGLSASRRVTVRDGGGA